MMGIGVLLMRPGFNAIRRNRNIGTSQQGHGKNNSLCIASPSSVSGIYWEQLGNYSMVRRECGGRELAFFVEQTREDCVHACTIADIVAVLVHVPAQDYESLAAIVLRQPKRKEEVLACVWGRLLFGASLGRPQDGSVEGRAIVLESTTPDMQWSMTKSLRPDAATELERLAADGHLLVRTKNRIQIKSSLEAIRATQLYRTLPHEIGHLVDYNTKVPENSDTFLENYDRYWQRPSQERESFAHRYADEFRARMIREGVLPFARIESWEEDGLRAADFVASTSQG